MRFFFFPTVLDLIGFQDDNHNVVKFLVWGCSPVCKEWLQTVTMNLSANNSEKAVTFIEKLQQMVATPINGSIWYRNKGEKEGW